MSRVCFVFVVFVQALLCSFAAAQGSSIAFVQVNSAVPQTPQSTVSVPFISAQTAGNLNVVVVGWNDSTAAVQSIADTSGNTYILAVGPTIQSGTATQSIYYAKNIVAAAANGNTVTVTFTAAATFPDIRIAEYSGLDTVNPFDGSSASQGNSSGDDSGSVTITASNDLLVGANLVQTATSQAGTGFTSRVITNPDGDVLEDQVVTVTGTYDATASLTNSGPWVMQIVAFRAASTNGFVQSNSATPQTPQSTVTASYLAAQSAGNLNVVVVGWNDSTSAVQSVSDTAGNTYALAVGPTVQSGVATQAIYYAKNIAHSAANANTVTVAFTAAARFPDIRIAEYSGIDPVNPLDTSAAAQGNNASADSGSATTSSTKELLIGASLVQSMTTAAGTGFTNRIITAADSDILEDGVVTATGSYNATAALDKSQQWIMQLVTFRMPPTIASLSPASGPVGASVTISGTNFGATQGSSTVTFNGVSATPSSWSETSIVVPVPSGATSGNVVVTVGGVASNGAPFAVAPSISGLSPISGPVGTSVSITGSSFGSTQGTSTVTFNGTSSTPSTWTDTQIIAPVPVGATTGNVIVTVATLASNAVAFTVTASGTSPSISTVSPSTGGIGATVTITGLSFGNSQGQSTVTFNSVAATTVSWSDTSIVARVPAGLNPGTATVTVNVSQLASNGVQFTVTQPLFLIPSQATMLAGQTRTVQLLDENGALISNPAWSFDNSSIAEILPPQNPGDPTLLQADAAGITTLTATFGNRTGTAKITVLSAGATLPIGSIQWEIPSLGPGRIGKTVQSLRVDDNTPDLYAEDDGAFGGNGAIRALNADGSQKWIWRPAGTDNSPFIAAADDLGGVVYFATMDSPNQFGSFCYFGRLDENGVETWQYQETNCREDYAIHPDGTIFLVEPAFQNTNADFITALDPATGQIKFTIPAPGDVFTRGAMSISSDGTVYLPFSTNVDTQMMSIQSDGSFSTQQLDSIPVDGLGRAIPDGQGGALVTASLPPVLYHASTSGTSKFPLPVTPSGIFDPFFDDGPMLVGEDGTAYIAGSSDPEGPVNTQLAVDPSNGTVKWSTVPGGTPFPSTVMADGSIAFQHFQGAAEHLTVATPTGQLSPLFANPTDGSDAAPANASNPSHWTLETWHVSLNNGASLAAISGPTVDDADAYSQQNRGNEQGQAAEPKGVKFEPNPSAPGILSAHCTGLDDTKNLDPRWLMVPLSDNNAPGSNTVLLKVKRGWQNVQLMTADTSTVTVSPDRPTDNATVLTLTGSKVGVVNITAVDSNNPSSVKATLRVSVKPKQPWIVSLFGVTEQNSAIAPTNIPDPANLLQYLTSAYGKQANIFFSVNPPPALNLQIHYDLDNNKRLNFVGRSAQGPEADAITNYMLAIPRVPAANEKWVFYVHEINPTSTEGFAGLGAAFLEDQATNGQTQKTAHELGHTLGISFNSTDKLDLMYETADGSQPCRIPRSQWKLINPTPNDNASTP